jgi:hypothetical protein
MTAPQKERFDYERAREYLVALFEQAENDYRDKQPPAVPDFVMEVTGVLFASPTQSYREALLGCGLARLVDRAVNIRHPYINQGPDAFNGRTLDEQVINPFLHDRSIPSSKGPYLASFRRSVKFVPETAQGLRDKRGYQAFLDFISELEKARTDDEVILLLRYLLYHFVALRDASNIPLARIARLSLAQYERLIDGLLQTPSGGLLPVLLTVAMFNTIRQCFNLDWEIDWQGINVADRASGVGGDITIRRSGRILLAVEVTERPIDRSRVASTFNTKISPHGIEDYLFFSTDTVPSDEVRAVVVQYFAQGHDVNFLQVKPWLINNMGTIGARCRSIFTTEFLRLMDSRDVPAALKVTWNDLVKKLLS